MKIWYFSSLQVFEILIITSSVCCLLWTDCAMPRFLFEILFFLISNLVFSENVFTCCYPNELSMSCPECFWEKLGTIYQNTIYLWKVPLNWSHFFGSYNGFYLWKQLLNTVIASVDKEYKVLLGKRRKQGNARNFRFLCKILHSSKSKIYNLNMVNLVSPCKIMLISKQIFLQISWVETEIWKPQKNAI